MPSGALPKLSGAAGVARLRACPLEVLWHPRLDCVDEMDWNVMAERPKLVSQDRNPACDEAGCACGGGADLAVGLDRPDVFWRRCLETLMTSRLRR